jgi:hypothetical protein
MRIRSSVRQNGVKWLVLEKLFIGSTAIGSPTRELTEREKHEPDGIIDAPRERL